MILMPMFSPTVRAPSGVTMVAGEFSGFVFGYGNGTGFPGVGSLEAEPLVGEVLAALAYNSSAGVSQLIYEGEIATTLSLLTLYVDNTPFSLAGAVNDSGSTFISWPTGGPIFENGHSYNIRIE